MKKKVIKTSTICAIILFCVLWMFGEKKFSLKLEEIKKIEIFNGNTGHSIIIQDKDEIEKIVNNLNGVSMRWKEVSFLKLGYSLKFSVYNEKGKMVKSFIINSEDCVRKTFFSYKVIKGKLNYEYFYELVEKNGV